MNREQLFEQIRRKRSFLCVGLDTDYRKIPRDLKKNDRINKHFEDTVYKFNCAIIDATAQYAVAYKPNLAFYEARADIRALIKTCLYIKHTYPDMLIIADAKRGDIGNTSDMYAEAFLGLNAVPFDAVTLAPYMGRDSVDAFLKYPNKWAIILALTSNPSADDFETLKLANGDPLWKEVLRKAKTWGCEPHEQLKSSTNEDRVMFVVGATRAETLKEVREIVPDHFLLVPGVGAQGGNLEDVARHGMNSRCGLLVNSSRGIIYAGEKDPRWNTEPGYFAEAAAAEAKKMAGQMSTLLEKYL